MSFRDFYDYLEDLGMVDPPDAVEVVDKLPTYHLAKIHNKCQLLIEEAARSAADVRRSLFNFSASNSVCGSGENCNGVQCRIGEATNLGMFAALYSDTVTVPNFFEHQIKQDLKKPAQLRWLRQTLKGNLTVFLYYKPLILEGVLRINPSQLLHCGRCLARLVDGDEVFEDEVAQMQNTAERLIRENISLSVQADGRIKIEDPRHMLGEGQRSHFVRPGKAERRRMLTDKSITDEVIQDIARTRADRVVNDLVLQRLADFTRGTTYLTQRHIDGLLMEAAAKERQERQDATVKLFAENLQHALPFLDGLEPHDIVNVRKEESPSFGIYRDSITLVLRQLGTSPSPRMIDEALHDEINPKILRIDQALKANRTVALRKARAKVVSGAALLTIGQIAQKSFPGIIDPAIVGAITGGISMAAAAHDAANAKIPPKETFENDYYFLWKLKQKVEG